jgi:transcriptional regulator with XRE-family HTH domain
MLQRARQARGLTLEEVERDTRISRRYLQALENENFGLLPAPVYARGFLSTYARYLGLEPANLLPLFPVGHVEEPDLQPWPKVQTPRTWPGSGLLAGAVVGVLILVVVLLYSLGGQGESSSNPLFGFQTATPEAAESPPGEVPAVVAAATETPVVPVEVPPGTMPDLRAQHLTDAAVTLREMGLSYLVVEVRSEEMPEGHIVRQNLEPGSDIDPDQVVTLEVSRGP